MKTTQIMTPDEIASYGYQQGYNQALSWVREMGQTLFSDKPDVLKALEFVTSQIEAGRETVHQDFTDKFSFEFKPIQRGSGLVQ